MTWPRNTILWHENWHLPLLSVSPAAWIFCRTALRWLLCSSCSFPDSNTNTSSTWHTTPKRPHSISLMRLRNMLCNIVRLYPVMRYACVVCFNKSLVGLLYACILRDRSNHSGVSTGINKWKRLLYNLPHCSVSVNQTSGQNGRGGSNSTTRLSTHQLAWGCQYGKVTEELICDRLVISTRDESLSEQLQIESDLTLEKAKKLVRQREAIQQQQSTLKGNKGAWTTTGKPQKRVPIFKQTDVSCSNKYLQKMWGKNHIPASFALKIMPFVSTVIGRVTSAPSAYLKLWKNLPKVDVLYRATQV